MAKNRWDKRKETTMKTIKTTAAAVTFGVLVVFAGPMPAEMWVEEVFGVKLFG